MKHFTFIGITNLLGEPICCIVIIEGSKKILVYGMALVFLTKKLEMRVMEDKTFTCMSDLTSMIQVVLVVLTK